MRDIETQLQRVILTGLARIRWSDPNVLNQYLDTVSAKIDIFCNDRFQSMADRQAVRASIGEYIDSLSSQAIKPGFNPHALISMLDRPTYPETAPESQGTQPPEPVSSPGISARAAHMPISLWLPPLAAAVLSVAGMKFFFPADPSACISGTCHDSGWVAAELPTKSIEIEHGLLAIPQSISVWFSPDGAASAFPLMWRWDQGTNGNPMSIRVDTQKTVLVIYNNNAVPLGGAFRPDLSAEIYRKGFFRVIVRK